MPTAAPRLRADLTLLGLTLLWAGTFVVVKDALAGASPFSFLAVRFLVGALAATALAGRRLFHRPSVRAGLVLSGLLFLGFAMQTTGLAHTTPARSAFITGLSVLLVPFFAWLVFRRLPTWPTVLGIALATVGLALFTHAFDGGARSPTLEGDVLTLLGAVAFSAYQTLNERYAPEVHPVASVAVQLWVVCLLSAGLAPFFSPRFVVTPRLVVAVVFCGLFASALAFTLQTWAQRHTTAVRTALIFALEPVFAAIISVTLGRETLDLASVAGGALIVVGVVASELVPARARRVGLD